MNGQQPTSEALGLVLRNSEAMRSAGIGLARTLYGMPLDLLLSGPVGSGKTTFLRGFFLALGVEERITSPTFALEQRYASPSGTPLLHIDLYRLSREEARTLLSQSDDFEGIRCIEWPEIAELPLPPQYIHLQCVELEGGRSVTMTFADVTLPSVEQIHTWRSLVGLPAHIAAHCEAVAECAMRFASTMIDRGIPVRREALRRAALLHDLLRFVDFRDGAGPMQGSTDARWLEWKNRYPTLRHEAACATFLREQGYDAVAKIVATHGLRLPPGDSATIEQMLLFYADKRTALDKVVSLKERFDDFRMRYAAHAASPTESEEWYREAQRVEAQLFPNGLPF